jgi:hypothetical protein
MHLIERYSLSTGLKIDNPQINSPFYPVAADTYVVFHTSAKDNLRDYDYWHEVKTMLQPLFDKHGLKTVQIGLEKDPTINCDIDLRGKTNINQMAYVVKNCDYFIGVDSFPAHLAGHYDKKMLAIYANSYAACVRPYWGNPENQKIIETHRPDGDKPSFSFNENPKTINRLKPDEIAKEFCDLIDPEFKSQIPEVLYIGEKYKIQQIEIIPDNAYGINHDNIFVRMDLFHNEENLERIVSQYTVSVITKKPIKESILKSGKIKLINYVSDEFDSDFVNNIREQGIDMHLICTKKDNLQKERIRFFDYKVFPFDEQAKIKKSKSTINIEDVKNLKIASNKKVFKNKSMHNSHYEANDCKNIDDLMLDLEWVMLYNVPEK